MVATGERREREKLGPTNSNTTSCMLTSSLYQSSDYIHRTVASALYDINMMMQIMMRPTGLALADMGAALTCRNEKCSVLNSSNPMRTSNSEA